MSLLTDEEIAAAIRTAPLEQQAGQTMIIAQRAKTLKAVAEWGDGYCDHRLNMEGHPVDSPPKRRRSCIFCRENLLEATRQGKMPGEGE